MSEFFPFNFGKALLAEEEWKNLKCDECSGEMELVKNNEFEEVKTCKDCGYKVLLIKKLRYDLND